MSANTAHANGGVLIYNGEIILLYCDGVELSIEGINAKEFGGTKKGRIYLTTHRMIFLNKSEKDQLQSFSFPFFSMTNVELEQPIFGANFIKGLVHAQAGGNWAGKATFKLKFFSGGAIEFGQAMLRAAQMANQYMPPAPPPYTPHVGPYYPAAPPAYMPPPGGVNGFIPPTHVFPDAPPANSVYTMDMPPPYPGIYPPPYRAPESQMFPQAATNGYAPQPTPNGYPAAGPTPPGFAPAPGPGQYPGAPPAGAYAPYPQTAGAYPSGPYPGSAAAGTYPSGSYQGTAAAGTYPQGPYPGAPPPAYNPNMPQMQPGAPGQFSGTTQQPPSNESKGSAPPIYDMFSTDPTRVGQMYTAFDFQNPQGPPPPYFEQAKKDQ